MTYASSQSTLRHYVSADEAKAFLDMPIDTLMACATQIRDDGHGRLVSYSRKVFIPLTELCRDVCHYCTFAKTPKKIDAPFLSPEQVLEIARAGQVAGCKEALFTLGDKPELRYAVALEALAEMGYETTSRLPACDGGIGDQRNRSFAPS